MPGQHPGLGRIDARGHCRRLRPHLWPRDPCQRSRPRLSPGLDPAMRRRGLGSGARPKPLLGEVGVSRQYHQRCHRASELHEYVSEGGLELMSLGKHLVASLCLELHVWPIVAPRILRPDASLYPHMLRLQYHAKYHGTPSAGAGDDRRHPAQHGRSRGDNGLVGPASVLHHVRRALLLDPAACGAVRRVIGSRCSPGRRTSSGPKTGSSTSSESACGSTPQKLRHSQWAGAG
jgi:hypothetical protein